MNTGKVSVRDNWPVVVFTTGLIIVVVLTLISDGPGWCDTEEAGVVCGREWVNAAGKLLTVVVAIIAAAFAYAQVIAARRQADVATLPALDQRLSALHLAY